MKTAHNYYVYIVQCQDSSYYIGITNDIDRRLWEHNTGYSKTSYTYPRRPVELKYFEHFTDSTQAIIREKQIKGWTREKKEALFTENWDLIKELSRRKQQQGIDEAPRGHPSLRQAQGRLGSGQASTSSA